MTTQVITYTCDETGKIFNTLEEAQECERVAKAIQYICDRVGVTADVAATIVTIVGHKPELFINNAVATPRKDYSLMKGPITVSVNGRAGSGMAFIHDILVDALSSTHNIEDSGSKYTIELKQDE